MGPCAARVSLVVPRKRHGASWPERIAGSTQPLLYLASKRPAFRDRWIVLFVRSRPKPLPVESRDFLDRVDHAGRIHSELVQCKGDRGAVRTTTTPIACTVRRRSDV